MDILDKLKSQIGDDVQYIFDREALFKEAISSIQDLRQYAVDLEKELKDRTERFERENNLLMAQVERLLAMSNSMDDDFQEHKRTLEAQVRAADALAEWVEGIIEDGCPKCGGDCSAANPPVAYCPQLEAMSDLAAYRAAKEGGA